MSAGARLLVLVLLPLSSSSFPLTETDRCLTALSGAERLSCLERSMGGRPLVDGDVRALERLLEEDPAGVARLAGTGEPSTGPLRARLLGLRGEALLRLGRHEEAADALLASVGMDDGTTRMTWLREGGEGWTISLGAGDGRLQGAARALALAGREAEARPLLSRLLSLGIGGDVREAWKRLGGGPIPGLDASPSAIVVRPWFRPLPDVGVPLLGGGSFPLSSARGRVLLLDFWASWCAPCLQELPALQNLYAEEKKRGLEALAINTQEPERVARRMSQSLGLTVPIGLYDDALDRTFRVRTLPTVILADRQGRIRARWNGYAAGFERVIAERVRALLGDDPEGADRTVAEVLRGGGVLEAWWWRELPARGAGIAVVRTGKDEARVAVTAEGLLLLLAADGTVAEQMEVPPAAGRLRRADLDGDGAGELVGFRPGTRDGLLFDLRQMAYRPWTAPAPLVEVALIPAAPRSSSEGRLVLGTTEGIHLSDPAGKTVARFEGIGETAALAAVGAGGTARIAALVPGGPLRWFDAAGRSLGEQDVPEGTRRLLLHDSTPRGVGAAPDSVTAGATGRFLPGGDPQAAVATASGQLVLVDLAGGEVRFRARWEGIEGLEAGDLDGDGRDELLVVAGRNLVVLSDRATTAPGS